MRFQRLRKIGGMVVILSVLASGVTPVVPAEEKAVAATEYTITLNMNDGTGKTEKVQKFKDEQLLMSNPAVTHEGFNFQGWAYDPLAARPDFVPGDYYKENASATLYGIWRRSGEGTEYYLKYKRTLKVNDATALCGKSFTLSASVAEGGMLKYTSSNSKILTLNSSGKGTPKSCGTVKITVTAPEDGLYAETSKTVTVTVKPATPTITKLNSPSKGLVSCSWKKCKGVTGYQICINNAGRLTYLKWKKTSFTAGGKSGATYKVKVRAYKKSGSKTVYGGWSKVKKVSVR